MEPIWAAVVAGMAVAFLAVDFWWDKRRTEKRERQSSYGIGQIGGLPKPYRGGVLDATGHHEADNINAVSAYPSLDEIMERDDPPLLPYGGAHERNIDEPLERGNEPQAYYRMHGDVYILPLRSHEWETVRHALATMDAKSMYVGDRNVIQRRMENVDKL